MCPPQELPELISWTQEGTIVIPDPNELEVRAARAPCLASSFSPRRKSCRYTSATSTTRRSSASSTTRARRVLRAPRSEVPSTLAAPAQFGFNKLHKSSSRQGSVYVRVKGEQLKNMDFVELLQLRPVLERNASRRTLPKPARLSHLFDQAAPASRGLKRPRDGVSEALSTADVDAGESREEPRLSTSVDMMETPAVVPLAVPPRVAAAAPPLLQPPEPSIAFGSTAAAAPPQDYYYI